MNEFIQQMQALLANPYFWGVALGYYLIIAAIGALEMPKKDSGAFYHWFFRFANGFAANLKRAARAAKLPDASDPL